MGLLAEMADIVVSDWGDNRRLQIREDSPFSEILGIQRKSGRDEWFRGYFGSRIAALLSGIVDFAYGLDAAISRPSIAGISVVEYSILRPMLEYNYRLFWLVQLEIGVHEREKRLIEDWNSDYVEFQKLGPEMQMDEGKTQFEKWNPLLKDWYEELTGREEVHKVSAFEIFNAIAPTESWWPEDKSGHQANPVYELAYRAFSGIEHGNLYAIQKLAMSDDNFIRTRGEGLDDVTLLTLQTMAGWNLQSGYASVQQFLRGSSDSRLMNRLQEYLDTFERMKTGIQESDS